LTAVTVTDYSVCTPVFPAGVPCLGVEINPSHADFVPADAAVFVETAGEDAPIRDLELGSVVADAILRGVVVRSTPSLLLLPLFISSRLDNLPQHRFRLPKAFGGIIEFDLELRFRKVQCFVCPREPLGLPPRFLGGYIIRAGTERIEFSRPIEPVC